jgi:hypothetical protein
MLRDAKTAMGLLLPTTYKDAQHMVPTKTSGSNYSPFPCNLGVNLDFKETPLGNVDQKRISRRPEPSGTKQKMGMIPTMALQLRMR